MRNPLFIATAALAVSLVAAGCSELPSQPASVINLGLRPDSNTGAIIVRKGDTVGNISSRYRLPLREIIDLNALAPPYTLSPGQRLKLPAPVEYRIRTGDTLEDIAAMFGTGLFELTQINRLQQPYRIRPGNTLRIPSSTRGIAVAAASADMPAIQRPPSVSPVFAAPLAAKPMMKEHLPLKTPATAGFIWPVRGKVISSYGAKKGGLYNDGINIAAPKGATVAAAEDGVIAYAGNNLKNYGNLILIRHAGGKMTAYAHLGEIKIAKGAKIRKGQTIGTVGATGDVSLSQLHFEIRQGTKTYDPQQYLG